MSYFKSYFFLFDSISFFSDSKLAILSEGFCYLELINQSNYHVLLKDGCFLFNNRVVWLFYYRLFYCRAHFFIFLLLKVKKDLAKLIFYGYENIFIVNLRILKQFQQILLSLYLFLQINYLINNIALISILIEVILRIFFLYFID